MKNYYTKKYGHDCLYEDLKSMMLQAHTDSCPSSLALSIYQHVYRISAKYHYEDLMDDCNFEIDMIAESEHSKMFKKI